MKAKHKTQRYDYGKIEKMEDRLEYWQFFGLHPKKGRIHVDTKRFSKILRSFEAERFLHDGMFRNRKTAYLIPAKVHRYDYKINRMLDLLNGLETDWVEEYKPLLGQIESPQEIRDKNFIEGLSMTGCADDYDEVALEANMASFRRYPKYNAILQSLYCQFICKICTEVDRFTLILVKELGYSQRDFGVKSFRIFTDALKGKTKENLLDRIQGYEEFELLHKINNFLKHNTLDSYDGLRKKYPDDVLTSRNGRSYENGMFAGDWIVVRPAYIDGLFSKLRDFFANYCRTFLGEDMEEASWNYDDYFKEVFKELKKPVDPMDF